MESKRSSKTSPEHDDRDLRSDEVRANLGFARHGVRISRESGSFELRGDLNSGQEAYFDPACKELISEAVQRRVQKFFDRLDGEVVERLGERGFTATLDPRGGFSAPDVPPEELRECIRAVSEQYK
ncbi:hypothetical protein ACFWQC_01800 [Nocardioides sp. NPDC058538]|uniref:hypothetical protein n=1 Tax=Nocardioides sp. NPDC058538 TaxID=3346542 RepID=UPI00365AC821